MMHQKDLIQERRLQAVDGSLNLHSYDKEKNFGHVTNEVACVGDDDPEIK